MSDVVWSPSQCERFLLCPQKWWFGVQEGEQPPTGPQLVGQAIHRGMAACMGDEEVRPETVALQWFDDHWHEGIEGEPKEWAALMDRGLMRLMEKREALLADHGRVRGCEVVLGEGEKPRYPGTADLITEHGTPEDRYVVVSDYKTHMTLDDRWVAPGLEETERSFQLYQYAWFAQRYYSLPVRFIRKVMVRCAAPTKVWIHAVEVDQEKLRRWYAVAQEVWAEMRDVADDGVQAITNWHSCTRYGKCQYYYRKECHG